ncbi:MAG TPA: carboxylesterase family protein [Nocardioides sp.]|nr:carboxylesterase family protein [Nocardioides sp.]
MSAVVRVSGGLLRGDDSGPVLAFRGIPYGAPPVGPLRWQPPEPVPPWSGVRDAVAFGPVAPQAIDPERLARRGLTMGEDCLSLNVWTPGLEGPPRPVLVFLHGGGQAAGHGSAPLFDGSGLTARGDIVVVTISFRLGVLGSLFAPDRLGPGSTNLALRDQVAALAWVRAEIAAFGGDPSAVTVYGQSSGAVGIAALLAGGCDLFDQAILSSGGLERVRATSAAAAVAEQVLAALPEDPRTASVEEILAVQRTVPTGFVPPQGPFHPHLDGDVIPEHPLVVARTQAMRPIPLLVGTTSDEWRVFDAGLPDDEADEAAARARAQVLLGEDADVEAALASYRSEGGSWPETGSALVTDYHFTAPTEQLARAHAGRGNRVHRYELQWPSPRPGLGACHDTCLPLVFGSLAAAPMLAGDGAEARAMSATVQDAWIAFVRGGQPWAPYDGQAGPTMLLGPRSGVVRGHRAEQLALWDGRYPAYP